MPATGRYCAQGDLVPGLLSERVLAQLTCDDGSATTVDETVVAAWIVAAEAEVDGHLGRRYELPLSRVPALVTGLAARVARYRAYMSRPGGMDESIKADYDDAKKTLSAIGAGEMHLGLTEAGEAARASRASAARVRSSSAAPVFGRRQTEGY